MVYGVFIAQAWPHAAVSRRLEPLVARAGFLLLLVLAAASLQPVLYCAVEPGFGLHTAVGALMALWVPVLVFAHLSVGLFASRLRRLSTGKDEEAQG